MPTLIFFFRDNAFIWNSNENPDITAATACEINLPGTCSFSEILLGCLNLCCGKEIDVLRDNFS